VVVVAVAVVGFAFSMCPAGPRAYSPSTGAHPERSTLAWPASKEAETPAGIQAPRPNAEEVDTLFRNPWFHACVRAFFPDSVLAENPVLDSGD